MSEGVVCVRRQFVRNSPIKLKSSETNKILEEEESLYSTSHRHVEVYSNLNMKTSKNKL